MSFSVGNSRTAGKRVVAEGLLPILGRDELGAIQELSAIQKRSGELGIIEHCFEKVRPIQTSSGQVRVTQVRSSEIGIPKIRSGEVRSAQIEPSQTGPR